MQHSMCVLNHGFLNVDHSLSCTGPLLYEATDEATEEESEEMEDIYNEHDECQRREEESEDGDEAVVSQDVVSSSTDPVPVQVMNITFFPKYLNDAETNKEKPVPAKLHQMKALLKALQQEQQLRQGPSNTGMSHCIINSFLYLIYGYMDTSITMHFHVQYQGETALGLRATRSSSSLPMRV